jgi:hypothetical protein
MKRYNPETTIKTSGNISLSGKKKAKTKLYKEIIETVNEIAISHMCHSL